ncbi:Uncharacterized protein Rs2_03454 [Raphanus sativus]|nr:Uncharacterized protein Rs2_03454 [Raphanus sativus]
MLCLLSVITLFRHFTLLFSTTCTLLPRLSQSPLQLSSSLYLIERLLSLSLLSSFRPRETFWFGNKQTDLVLIYSYDEVRTRKQKRSLELSQRWRQSSQWLLLTRVNSYARLLKFSTSIS